MKTTAVKSVLICAICGLTFLSPANGEDLKQSLIVVTNPNSLNQNNAEWSREGGRRIIGAAKFVEVRRGEMKIYPLANGGTLWVNEKDGHATEKDANGSVVREFVLSREVMEDGTYYGDLRLYDKKMSIQGIFKPSVMYTLSEGDAVKIIRKRTKF